MLNLENINLPDLNLNDSGVYVQYLTLALRRAGYLNSVSDTFDENVRTGLENFLTNMGMQSSNVVTQDVWNVLIPYLAGYTTVPYTDNLENLADRFSTTQNAINTANPNLTQGTDIVVPFGYAVVPTDVDYTYALTLIVSHGLEMRYPFLKTQNFGKSVMQKNLFYLEIGEGDNEIMINASHHANEWITTPVVLKFAEDFLNAYANNSTIYTASAETLYNTRKIFIVPLVNPDGVDLVNDAVDKSSDFYSNAVRISQNYPNIPFPDGWKANINGTDLNLNYPAGWENARQIKYAQGYTSPAPRDFVGTAPLSSPESRAMYNFTLNHNFLITLSYHTQGNVIYWKYLDYLPPYSLEIGEALSMASGYTLETTPTASGYAGYKDWFISYFNLPGYTIEAGLGENPLPISQFGQIYSANLPLIVTAVEKTE